MSSIKDSSTIANDGPSPSTPGSDLEKATPSQIEENEENDPDLDHVGGREGYVLDAQAGLASSRHLKTTKDGSTILIPQPSDDPNDPLNWSQFQKNLVLVVVSLTALLPDYGSATGAVTLIPQATIWGMSENEVNHSQVGNVFMLGAGGVVAVALSAYFGRYPVLFWFILLAVATAAWCAGATTFESFMAARILNGFFSTVAQGGGLMFIKDLFFFHEHARKINIWAAFIILSPYVGPLFGAFIISTQEWQWAFGVYTIETGLCLIGIMLFVDETYYDRHIPAESQPPRYSKIMRMVGVSQWRSRNLRNSFGTAVSRPFIVVSKLPIALTAFYYCITFAWVVGINTTLSIFLTPLYDFGPKQIGFFYFTPIIAAILGETLGHWLHDLNARWYMHRHQGRLEPEARLAVIWLSTPFMLAGLVLLGFALERGYHYMITALGWGMYVFGIMVTTVGLNAYVLDSYPEASGEVAAWLNFGRTAGGFIVSYFQVNWANAEGTEKSMGIQAAICASGLVFIVLLQVFGKRLRIWSGESHFKTN